MAGPDPLDALISDIRSPDKETQVSVLPRLEGFAWNPEMVSRLAEMAKGETDPATASRLWALLSMASPDQASPPTLEKVEEILDRSPLDGFSLITLLRSLPENSVLPAIQALRNRGLHSFDPHLQPHLLKFFRRHGTPDDIPALIALCKLGNPRVLSAAVEVLEKINPEALKELIVPLLSNPLPEVRSQAIRLLHRWDPQEASKHFEALLMSDRPEERKAALFHAYFFPFPRIEGLLLRFLAAEDDPEMLQGAGKLFLVNPSIETALKLVDIFETSNEARRGELKKIIIGIVTQLSKADSEGKTAEGLMAELQSRYRAGKQRAVVERCRAHLLDERLEVRRTAAGRLLELAKNGDVDARSVLASHFSNETDPAFRERLGKCLGVLEKLSGKAQPQEQESVRVRAFAVLAREKPTYALERCDALLAEASLDEQVEILRLLPSIQKQKGLEILSQFIFSTQSLRRRVAIFALDAFDFPSIEEPLVASFSQETDQGNLRALTAFLGKHLSPNVLLEIIKQAPDPESEQGRRLQPFIQELSGSIPREVEKGGPPLPEPQGSVSAPEPEYSVTRIRMLRSEPAETASTPATQPSPHGPAAGTVGGSAEELGEALSPDPVVAFQALLRLRPTDLSTAQVEVLEGIKGGTPDPFKSFHIDLILSRRSARSEEGSREPPLVALERILHRPDPDLKLLADVLDRIARPDFPAAANSLRKHGWWRLPQPILPFILGFLKQAGTSRDGGRIESFCSHDDPRIALTAADALERVNPEDLKPHLKYLLSHPNLGIRSYGTRLLYKWDSREALRHFEGALFSESSIERSSALQNAFFLPFPAIESRLLKFAGMEEDVELIRKVGLLFRTNPLPDSPMKLLEIREASFGSKRLLVEEILAGVLANLSRSGLVDKNPNEILVDLKEEFRKRKIRLAIEQSGALLESEHPENRLGAVRRLSAVFPHAPEEVRALLRKHATGERDPEIISAIESICPAAPSTVARPETAESGRAEPEPTPIAPSAPAPKAEVTSWIDSVSKTNFASRRTEIHQLLKSEKTAETTRCLLLNVVGECGSESDLVVVRPFLKNPSPLLVAAAIEALESLSPEELLAQLPRFLHSGFPEVRGSAIRRFLRHDKRQALTCAEQMLGSARPGERSLGLFAAAEFDFLTVKDTLIAFLSKETDAALVKQAWTILAPNFSFDLLVQMVGAAEESDSAKALPFASLLPQAAEIIRAGNPALYPSVSEVLEKARGSAREELERGKNPPAYSWQSIQKTRTEAPEIQAPPAAPTSPGDDLAGLAEKLDPHTLIAGLGLAGVLVLVLLFFGGQDGGGSGPNPGTGSGGTAAQAQYPQLREGEIRDIQGSVERAYSDGAYVNLEGGAGQLFVRYPQMPRSFKAGNAFRAQVRVGRKTPQRLEADLLKIY